MRIKGVVERLGSTHGDTHLGEESVTGWGTSEGAEGSTRFRTFPFQGITQTGSTGTTALSEPLRVNHPKESASEQCVSDDQELQRSSTQHDDQRK